MDKVAHYRHATPYGTFNVPCEVIGEDEDGLILIRYFDPFLQRPVEDEVSDLTLITWKKPEVDREYLSRLAFELAMKMKTDMTVVDQVQLNVVANTVENTLLRTFNLT